jgi:hypothetical protein
MPHISQNVKPKAEQDDFFNMGSNIDGKNKLTNGAILIINMILKHVMSSAEEAEI